MKKITIIAPNSFGYIDFLVDKLKSIPNSEVTHVNYNNFKYKYRSIGDKFKNSINKIVLKKNIKDSYASRCILESITRKGKQDIIVVIRPDKIEKKTLLALKENTNNLYAFYFDAIANFPKKIELIPLFDNVFSYEKDDVKKYGLEFITNYIYNTDKPFNFETEHKIFNVSSYDERFSHLKSIARYLKKEQISYNIIVRKERGSIDDLIKIVPEYLPLSEVEQLILKSDVLLDIQKENQKGLSFRVFEALGYEKKLITTNKDIVTYDFYKPENILVIDVDNIDIPEAFINSTYQKVPDAILYPYTLDGWIKKVFSI